MTQAELEEDMWKSWWLAHTVIGDPREPSSPGVRAGLRELPPTFVPTRRNNHVGGIHKEADQTGP